MKSATEMQKISRDLKEVQELIHSGFDVNTLIEGDYYLLQFAILEGKTEVVEYLIMMGADVNMRNARLSTPLMAANVVRRVPDTQIDTLKLLLQHRADINAEDVCGATALHRAAWNQDREVVQLLFQYKADSTIETRQGETAVQFAKDASLQQLIEENIKEQKLQKLSQS